MLFRLRFKYLCLWDVSLGITPLLYVQAIASTMSKESAYSLTHLLTHSFTPN